MTDLYIIDTIAQWAFVFALAYYGMTNLQWYNYSFKRVLLMHHKYMWHIWYCALPLSIYIGEFFAPSPFDNYILVALGVVYFLTTFYTILFIHLSKLRVKLHSPN